MNKVFDTIEKHPFGAVLAVLVFGGAMTLTGYALIFWIGATIWSAVTG